MKDIKMAVRINWGIPQTFQEPFASTPALKAMYESVLAKGHKVVLLSLSINDRKYDVLFDGEDATMERIL